MVKRRNPYALYTPKTVKERKDFIVANRLITKAIKQKKWPTVEKLQTKYRKLGAGDTFSRDEMVMKYYKLHKKAPPGFVMNRLR